MADYTETKDGRGRVYPDNAINVTWEDAEPLITPDNLVTDQLLGIPLVSGVRDPITRKFRVVTPPEIERIINRAVSICETELDVDIFQKQYSEKHPFDRVQYRSFGFLRVKRFPVDSLQDFSVVTTSDSKIYKVPLDWIDVGQLRQGQINIIPLTITIRGGVVAPVVTGTGGSAFLSIFNGQHWLPSFWEVKYTTGFKDGAIPKIVNEYIGTVAAMELLSMLAATYARSTSNSLSIDGISESSAGPGAQLYLQRLEDLGSKRKWICKKLRARLGTGLVVDNA